MKLEDLLHRRVHRLAAKLALTTTREVLSGTGLSVNEWRLICHLAETPEMNLTAISRCLCLDPGPPSRLLKSAEEKRLVRRRIDRDDRRVSIFSVTPKARRQYEAIWPRALSIGKAFHGQFTDNELETLNRLIDRAADYADIRLGSDH